MLEEARLEDVGSGLAPVSDGWFVVNLRHAAWLTNDAFGARCVFEGGTPVLRGRPDLPAHKFAQVGLTLQVLHPGQPTGLYHAETNQEGFLVLAGECLLLVEGEERQLRAWDFVHCPPGTAHSFVGAGDGPYAIFMAGARTREKDTAYPHSDLPPSQVYDPFPDWQPQRPEPKGMPAGTLRSDGVPPGKADRPRWPAGARPRGERALLPRGARGPRPRT